MERSHKLLSIGLTRLSTTNLRARLSSVSGSPSPSYSAQIIPFAQKANQESGVNENSWGITNAQNTVSTPYIYRYAADSYKDAEPMSEITREELQARLDTVEAHTDTKIARLEGKLDLVLQAVQSSRQDALETAKISRQEANDNRRWIVGNMWVLFAAVVAVIAIIVTIAPVIFDMGVKWRETITSEINMRLHDTNVPKNPQ